MVKLDRIEHTVTIPEGVTANISEDGVVTITGPKGPSLARLKATWFNSSKTALALSFVWTSPDESSALWQERGTPTSTTWSRALPMASPTT